MSKPTHLLELKIEKVTVPEKVSKGLEIKLQLGTGKKTVRRPFQEKIILETDDISAPLQVSYLIDGENVGKSKVRLPKAEKSFTEPVDAKLEVDDKKVTIELDFIMDLRALNSKKPSRNTQESDSEDYPEEKPQRSPKKGRPGRDINDRARSISSRDDDQMTRYKNRDKRDYDDFKDSPYKSPKKNRPSDDKYGRNQDRDRDRPRDNGNFRDQFDNSSQFSNSNLHSRSPYSNRGSPYGGYDPKKTTNAPRTDPRTYPYGQNDRYPGSTLDSGYRSSAYTQPAGTGFMDGTSGYVNTIDPITGIPILSYVPQTGLIPDDLARQDYDKNNQIDYLKNIIQGLERQLKESQSWKNDAQRLQDQTLQQDRFVQDLEKECRNKQDLISADKQYIQSLEAQLQNANIAIDQTKNNLRNQDQDLNSKERHIQDQERIIRELQEDNRTLREKISDVTQVQDQLRRNHESSIRAQGQLGQIQANFQRMLQNNEQVKREYEARIDELTETVKRKTEDNTNILNDNQDVKVEIAQLKIELEKTRQKFSRALSDLEHHKNLQKNQNLQKKRNDAEKEYTSKKDRNKNATRRRENESEDESVNQKSRGRSERQRSTRDRRKKNSKYSEDEEEDEEEEQEEENQKSRKSTRKNPRQGKSNPEDSDQENGQDSAEDEDKNNPKKKAKSSKYNMSYSKTEKSSSFERSQAGGNSEKDKDPSKKKGETIPEEDSNNSDDQSPKLKKSKLNPDSESQDQEEDRPSKNKENPQGQSRKKVKPSNDQEDEDQTEDPKKIGKKSDSSKNENFSSHRSESFSRTQTKTFSSSRQKKAKNEDDDDENPSKNRKKSREHSEEEEEQDKRKKKRQGRKRKEKKIRSEDDDDEEEEESRDYQSRRSRRRSESKGRRSRASDDHGSEDDQSEGDDDNGAQKLLREMENLNRRVQNDLDAISRLKDLGYNVPPNFGPRPYTSVDRIEPRSQVVYPNQMVGTQPLTVLHSHQPLNAPVIHQTIPVQYGVPALQTPVRTIRYSPVTSAHTSTRPVELIRTEMVEPVAHRTIIPSTHFSGETHFQPVSTVITRSPLNRSTVIDKKSSLSPRRTFVTRTTGTVANRVEVSPAPGLNHHNVQTIMAPSPITEIRTSPMVTSHSIRTGTPIQYHSEEITIQDNLRTIDDSVQRRNLSTLLGDFNTVYRYTSGDVIDETLNDFIVNSVDSESLAKLFLRESPGVYLFGSKVVTLTLENGILFGKFLLFQLLISQSDTVRVIFLQTSSQTSMQESSSKK